MKDCLNMNRLEGQTCLMINDVRRSRGGGAFKVIFFEDVLKRSSIHLFSLEVHE